MADTLVRVHDIVSKKSEQCQEANTLSECGFLICSLDSHKSVHIIDLIVASNKDTQNELAFLRDQSFCVEIINGILPEGIFIGGIYLKESIAPKYHFQDQDILNRLTQIFTDTSVIDPDLNTFYYFLQKETQSFLYKCSLTHQTVKHVENIEFVSSRPKIKHKTDNLTFPLQKCFINIEMNFNFNLIHVEASGNLMKIEFIQALEKLIHTAQISFILHHSLTKYFIVNPNSIYKQDYKSFIISNTDFISLCFKLKHPSDDQFGSGNKPNAPYFYFKREKGMLYSYKMALKSSIFIFPLELPKDQDKLFTACMNSLKKQIQILLFKLRESPTTQLSSHSTMLFNLPSSNFPISCFVHDIKDANLALSIKKMFGVKRVINFIAPHLSLLPRRDQFFNLLISPHKLINKLPVGDVYTVEGKYAYFHYGSEGINDQGWGCAYRCFQTIYSWLVFNGYANPKPFPSIVDIQKYLVELDDKPASFIGSNGWIGSVEIGMVLNRILDIQYRIQTVSQGSDILLFSSAFMMHFKNVKCPIMIGGNKYAHTILGIDYNSSSGDVKYLIADPHYVGPDDQTIIKKEWVGWKEISFFNQNSYYNIIFPIPNLII